jgi:subtilisin family serine protease
MLSSRTQRTLLAFVTALAAMAVLANGGLQEPERPREGGGAWHSEIQSVPNEVIIQFKTGVSPIERASARARVGAMHEELILGESRRTDGKGELDLAKLPPGIALHAAIQALAQHPAVEFAEPNWIYHHQAVANDPYYANGSLWGMYGNQTLLTNQYGSQAGEAWGSNGHTCSNTVYVGVIDEGIMYAHEDLAANMWLNPFDPDNGEDDDGNGYVDDLRGWDFNANDNTTYDGPKDDHGTHVAGTIGAVGGNSKGVAGVCWSVQLITAKFLGNSGGTTANAIKALDYITDLKTRHGLNIAAINNSWGGGGYSQGLFDAIERANAAEILFIAAAGNGGSDGVGDNNDTTPFYPASYVNANIIAVASITKDGSKSSFSNYGGNSVDLGAPGSSIYSTLPGPRNTSKYGSYSGTSMATPHVTGAAALYAASNLGASADAIRTAILNGAVPTSSLSGRTLTGGRLNVRGF